MGGGGGEVDGEKGLEYLQVATSAETCLDSEIT